MDQKPLRLLFQGDSITDAFRRPEEINPAYQLGNGYAFLAASRLALEHPERFEFYNRGISGQTVAIWPPGGMRTLCRCAPMPCPCSSG